jgi:hypothetical protein
METRPQLFSRSQFISAVLLLLPAISEHIYVFPPSFHHFIYFLVFSQQFLQTLSLSTGLINFLFLSSGAVVNCMALQEGFLFHGKKLAHFQSSYTPAVAYNWTWHLLSKLDLGSFGFGCFKKNKTAAFFFFQYAVAPAILIQ